MPSFNYTGSQGMIDTQPVQYNVQPNLSAERAFQKLQQGLTQAGQLKRQLDEQAFNNEVDKLRKETEDFDVKWAASDFDSKGALREELSKKGEQLANDDSYWGRQLYNKFHTIQSGYDKAYEQEGVESRYRDNQLMIVKSAGELRKELATKTNIADREELVATWKSMFLTAYEGRKDKYSQALHADAIKIADELDAGLITTRVAIKDQNLANESLDILATNIAEFGVPSPELWNDVIKKMEGVSDYAVKERDYKRSLFNTAMYGMATYAKNQPDTWDSYVSLQKQLDTLAKLDKVGAASDTFSSLQNSINAKRTTVINKEKNALSAAINTDPIPYNEVEKRSQSLLDRDLISEQEHLENLFNKRTRVGTNKVSAKVKAAYSLGSEGNKDLHDLFLTSNATASGVVGDNLENEMITTLSKGEVPIADVVKEMFAKQNEYIKLGMTPQKSPYIDGVLSMATDETITTPQQAAEFVAVYGVARENRYVGSGLNAKNEAVYQGLRGLLSMYPAEPEKAIEIFKNSGRDKVKGEDIVAVTNEIIDKGDFLTIDLNSRNERNLREFLEPTAKMLLGTGLSADKVASELENIFESQFVEAVQSGNFGGVERFYIKRKGWFDGEAAYKGIQEYYHAKASVFPKDPMNPLGDWVVFGNDGSVQTLKSEDAHILAMVGKRKQTNIDEQMMIAP